MTRSRERKRRHPPDLESGRRRAADVTGEAVAGVSAAAAFRGSERLIRACGAASVARRPATVPRPSTLTQPSGERNAPPSGRQPEWANR